VEQVETLTPPPVQSTRLLVIVLNYRTASLVQDCLESLVDEVQAVPGTRVIVTDNASPDDSLTQISTAITSHGWQDWVTLIPLERNGGFAYGNNAPIREALQSGEAPPYFLLLNPDTVVRPGALTALVEFMEQHPNVGIAGSRLEDLDGTPQISAFRFHTPISELDQGLRLGVVSKLLKPWLVAPPVSETDCPTDWVAGASMIVRRQVFEQVGLMDEDYFMYYEETDFCRQAKQAGWPCWYVPESRVVHLVGQSSGVTDTKQPPKRLPKYWFESRRRYFLKNYGWPLAALTDLIWVLSFISWRLRTAVQGKPNDSYPHVLPDFIRNSVWFHWSLTQPTLPEPSPKPSTQALTTSQTEPEADISAQSFGQLWSQIREDWVAHDKDWTRPGFRAIAIYRFGVWRMQVEPKILRAPLSILYRSLFRHARNVYGIELPYSAKLGRRVIIEHQGGIVIHGGCIIDDDCIIRQGVTLGNRYLDRPLDAPRLGKRVNIGAGAKVLGGIILGDDAIVGANAVVLKDIPAGQTAVGIPAKILGGSNQTQDSPSL
jgi:N-acetylglucosaminyl-diphospho-decaprenol L-rhamnosyltransferase